MSRYLYEYDLTRNVHVRMRRGHTGVQCYKCGRFLAMGERVVGRGRNNPRVSHTYGRKLYHKACAQEINLI